MQNRTACSWLEKGKRLLKIKMFGLLMFATRLHISPQNCTIKPRRLFSIGKCQVPFVGKYHSEADCAFMTFIWKETAWKLQEEFLVQSSNWNSLYIYIRYIDLPGLHPQLFHCGHQISIWHRCAISAKSHFTRRKRIKYVHMHVQVQNGSGKRTVRHCCNHVLRSLWADLPSMGQTSSLSWLDVCTRT